MLALRFDREDQAERIEAIYEEADSLAKSGDSEGSKWLLETLPKSTTFDKRGRYRDNLALVLPATARPEGRLPLGRF